VEKRNTKSLGEDFANHRGYETLEREADKFKEISVSGKSYLEVPKGRLNEPITGEYWGDIKVQGKNYHRIENLESGQKCLVPATEQGVPPMLRLRDVVYDGKDVLKAAEKVRDIAKDKAIDRTMERLLER